MELDVFRNFVSRVALLFSVFLHFSNSQLDFDGVAPCLNYIVQHTMSEQDYKTFPSPPNIKMNIISRDLFSVKIGWNYKITNFTQMLRGWAVEHKKIELVSDWDVSELQDIDSYTIDNYRYKFSGLSANSEYQFCVKACIEHGDAIQHATGCIGSKTLPFMRTDSIVALVITILYLGALCVLGVVQWKRASAKHEALIQTDVGDG